LGDVEGLVYVAALGFLVELLGNLRSDYVVRIIVALVVGPVAVVVTALLPPLLSGGSGGGQYPSQYDSSADAGAATITATMRATTSRNAALHANLSFIPLLLLPLYIKAQSARLVVPLLVSFAYLQVNID
jgi:hypothetical protein